MKKTILTMLLIFAFSTYSFSEDITGAFGIKFGTPLEKLKVINQRDEIVSIDPPKKVNFIDIYGVLITPKSKLVAAIMGVKAGLDPSECEDLVNTVQLKLEKKYNLKFINVFSMDIDRTAIKNGKRIELSCKTKYEDLKELAYFIIFYADLKLSQKVEKEKLEEKAKTIDDSGL